MKLNPVKANQTELELDSVDNVIVLFSYQTPVAYIHGNQGYKTERKWSVTTSKHINQFFNRHIVENITEVHQSNLDNLVNGSK